MSTDDAAIGFDSAAPRTRIPYSVSMPQILRIATRATLPVDLANHSVVHGAGIAAAAAARRTCGEHREPARRRPRRGGVGDAGVSITSTGTAIWPRQRLVERLGTTTSAERRRRSRLGRARGRPFRRADASSVAVHRARPAPSTKHEAAEPVHEHERLRGHRGRRSADATSARAAPRAGRSTARRRCDGRPSSASAGAARSTGRRRQGSCHGSPRADVVDDDDGSRSDLATKRFDVRDDRVGMLEVHVVTDAGDLLVPGIGHRSRRAAPARRRRGRSTCRARSPVEHEHRTCARAGTRRGAARGRTGRQADAEHRVELPHPAAVRHPAASRARTRCSGHSSVMRTLILRRRAGHVRRATGTPAAAK